MHQIDPIDDYIEPQLIIQAKAHEIEWLTRKGDFEAAFKANHDLQEASQTMMRWLYKRILESEK